MPTYTEPISEPRGTQTHFEVYQDADGDYRWRLRAGNGEIIADSAEGYRNKADCYHGIDLVQRSAHVAVEELQADE